MKNRAVYCLGLWGIVGFIQEFQCLFLQKSAMPDSRIQIACGILQGAVNCLFVLSLSGERCRQGDRGLWRLKVL
jgi:hypothetical protein